MKRGRRNGRIAHAGPPSVPRSLVSVPYPLHWRILGFPKRRNWQFIGGGSSLESARDGASHAELTLEMPKMLARTKCRFHMPWLLTSSRHPSTIAMRDPAGVWSLAVLYTTEHYLLSDHESFPSTVGIPRWDICRLACFTAMDDDHAVRTDKHPGTCIRSRREYGTPFPRTQIMDISVSLGHGYWLPSQSAVKRWTSCHYDSRRIPTAPMSNHNAYQSSQLSRTPSNYIQIFSSDLEAFLPHQIRSLLEIISRQSSLVFARSLQQSLSSEHGFSRAYQA